MATGSQIRMARAALRWSVIDLSNASGVSTSTIKRMEGNAGSGTSTSVNLTAVQKTLEAAGIEFVTASDGAPGIFLRQPE